MKGWAFSCCLALSSLALILLSQQQQERRVELDTINPFGSVEDVSLPAALGQPPTLKHMLFTSYGPGFKDNGQPEGSPFGPSALSRSAAHRARVKRARGRHLALSRLAARSSAAQQAQASRPTQPQRSASSAPQPLSPEAQKQRQYGLEARAAYWSALEEFYSSRKLASYDDWLKQKASWGSTTALRLEARGSRIAEQDKQKAAEEFKMSQELFHLSQPQADMAAWHQTQSSWDYFYTTDRLLNHKQRGIDQKRAEILAQFLPKSDSSAAMKVDQFVQPWQPFAACQEKESSLCRNVEMLRLPSSSVGFTPSATQHSAPGGSNPSLAEAKGGAAEGQGASAKLDEELKPLNTEQARLNKARMLLYLREFGAVTTMLPPFPGDFELPRVTDCDNPGHCHDWADGYYIDNFAAATTTWDYIGQPVPGYMHWDTLPDDTWAANYPDPQHHDLERFRHGEFGDGNTRWTDDPPAQPGFVAPDTQPQPLDGGNPPLAAQPQAAQPQPQASRRLLASGQSPLAAQPQAAQPQASRRLLSSGQSFDWREFNKQQAVLEARAEGAAATLLSPSLQRMPTSQLFGFTLPSAEGLSGNSLPSAEGLSGSVKRAVGGAGGWAETHDPSAPHSWPLGQEAKFSPPAGLPFGGNIASKPVDGGAAAPLDTRGLPFGGNIVSRPLEEVAAADQRHQQLSHKLHHIESLMDKQWSQTTSNSLPDSALRHRQQRLQAEGAAREARQALEAALGEKERVYGQVAEYQAPVKRRALADQIQVASRAISQALRRTDGSADDPSSRRQRGDSASLLRGAVVKVEKAKMLNRAKASAASNPLNPLNPLQQLEAKLERVERANKRLHQKLEAARKRGYGQSYNQKLQTSEQQVAKIVASRLSPKILKQAAKEVAAAVEAKAGKQGQSAVGAPPLSPSGLGALASQPAARRTGLSSAETQPAANQSRSESEGVGAEDPVEDPHGNHVDMDNSDHDEGLSTQGDDEPAQIHGMVSTTDHEGQKEFLPHYFNRMFWSQLYHYFKGDRPGDYCNICVGEYMTAMHDIKANSHATNAEKVPKICQAVCQTNQPPPGMHFFHDVDQDSLRRRARYRYLQRVAHAQMGDGTHVRWEGKGRHRSGEEGYHNKAPVAQLHAAVPSNHKGKVAKAAKQLKMQANEVYNGGFD